MWWTRGNAIYSFAFWQSTKLLHQNWILACWIKLKHKVNTRYCFENYLYIYGRSFIKQKSNDTQSLASRCKSYLHLSLGFLLYLISGTQRLSVVGVNTKGSSRKVALYEIILNSEKLSVSVRLHFRPTFPKVQITTLIPGREPCLVSVRKRLPLGNASNI